LHVQTALPLASSQVPFELQLSAVQAPASIVQFPVPSSLYPLAHPAQVSPAYPVLHVHTGLPLASSQVPLPEQLSAAQPPASRVHVPEPSSL
jgi:hypothetical protein